MSGHRRSGASGRRRRAAALHEHRGHQASDRAVTSRFHRAARSVVLLAVLAGPLATAGCSGDDAAGSPGSAATARAIKHNDQDVYFAQGMIPHHRQAIQVAALVATRASTPEVKQFAQTLSGTYGQHVSVMTGWLTDWGATVPAEVAEGGHDLTDMGDIGNGMLSRADVSKLTRLSGRAFERTYLTMMIKHHKGAITVATYEKNGGQATEAKALAAEIIKNRTAEIRRMQLLLRQP